MIKKKFNIKWKILMVAFLGFFSIYCGSVNMNAMSSSVQNNEQDILVLKKELKKYFNAMEKVYGKRLVVQNNEQDILALKKELKKYFNVM